MPPKSPILGDFETGNVGSKSPILGDLGGEDLSHDELRDLITRLTGYLIHDSESTTAVEQFRYSTTTFSKSTIVF